MERATPRTDSSAKGTSLQSSTTQATQAGFAKYPDLVVQESDETKDCKALQQKARSMLDAKDYELLDKLAADLRLSKETYADGHWKLWAFYGTFAELPKRASEKEWTALLDSLRDWVRQRPDSVTARVALADALTSYAWRARGGGYADTVTDTGWNLFRERLAESGEVLKAAKKLDTTCPQWFAVAQHIALGQGWPREQYEKLFQAAITFEPAYTSFYFHKVAFLLPRWYGREGEWEKFAEEAANRLGGEAGDILYARIAWHVHDGGFYQDVFRETRIDGNRVKRGYELMLQRYPDSPTVVAQFARLAILNGDPFRTRALLERLKGRVDLEIWSSQDYFEKVRNWAYKAGNPAIVAATQPQSLQAGGATSEPAKSLADGGAPPLKRELTLNGLSGPQGHRLAIINGQTLGVGESARIRLEQSEVKVRCEEIGEDSVMVTIDGQPSRQELHFRSGN